MADEKTSAKTEAKTAAPPVIPDDDAAAAPTADANLTLPEPVISASTKAEMEAGKQALKGR